MTNRDNPTGMDKADAIAPRERGTEGKILLVNLAKAIREKNLDELRVVAEEIVSHVQVGQLKCEPAVDDKELRDIIEGKAGGHYLAIVGSGSSGSRIVVMDGMISMPFGDVDEKCGYGAIERQAFKKLFSIPENGHPSATLSI